MLTAAVARELDFHARFTAHAIDKRFTLRFFVSPLVPTWQKAIVAVLLALLVAAALALVVREGPRFLRGLRARHPAAIDVAAALAALAAAIALDEARTPVDRAGLAVPEFAQTVEECLELGGAALIALVLLSAARGLTSRDSMRR